MGNYCQRRKHQTSQYSNLSYSQQLSQDGEQQDVKTIFNDDEPVQAQDLRKLSQKSKTNAYNLDKGLSIEVKSMRKYFKFNSEESQTLPVMVSLKTLNETQPQSKEKVKGDFGDERPNVDLVCVIDRSGSMDGDKIKNVKKALQFLLKLLGENDRICLIIFNTSGKRLFPLQKTNKTNLGQITKEIDAIYADGGTNINSGMELAFKVLKDRKTQNPVSSVFLLSDGQDQSAEGQVQNSIKRHLSDEVFTIHSFGFGQDHDAPMMNKICALKDGSFYYVEKINQVDEFFVDALGGLFSVVASEVVLDIKINQDGPAKKLFNDIKVTKTYGQMWNVIKENKSYQIKLNQFFSGISKDFIFELTVPSKAVKSLEDFERNPELITATVTAIPVDIQYTTKVVKDAKLTLTLFTNNESLAVDSEINDAVEFNYLRVQASEAIEEAMRLAELKEFQQSQKILKEMISKLDVSLPQNKDKLNIIKRDLLDCQVNSSPQAYEQQGRFKMYSKMNANMCQRSQAVEGFDLYQNCGQERFVSLARKNKGGIF